MHPRTTRLKGKRPDADGQGESATVEPRTGDYTAALMLGVGVLGGLMT
jgi:hypothetical protein